MSPAMAASMLLGASVALMLCGSVTSAIGFILMPWVAGLVLLFGFVDAVNTLSTGLPAAISAGSAAARLLLGGCSAALRRLLDWYSAAVLRDARWLGSCSAVARRAEGGLKPRWLRSCFGRPHFAVWGRRDSQLVQAN